MRKLFLSGAFLVLVASASALAGVIPDLPNVCQLKVDRSLPNGGSAYYGPVATANVLLWLSKHGYPALAPQGQPRVTDPAELVRELGMRMQTDEVAGTRPSQVVRGLHEYLRSRGLSRFRIRYEGHEHVSAPSTENPGGVRMSTLRNTVRGKRFAIVNVGWYAYDPANDTFTRKGGHWVTLAGLVSDHGQLAAIFHDPASATRPHAHFRQLIRGRVIGDSHRRDGSARGLYQLSGNLRPMGIDADCALLDGVVYLELGPPGERLAAIP